MNNTNKIKKRYDRYSRFYDFLEYPLENLVFKNLRSDIISSLTGKILEIGVGTGKNLKYYFKKSKVTGIDISSGMLKFGIKEKKRLKNKHIELYQMDAQKLQFENDTFNFVVCTFVLCSIPKPIKALREMNRVLKKGGKIIMLEHVLSKNKLVAIIQQIHNPLTKLIFGFNINRDTKNNILKANLNLITDKNILLNDIFKRFECIKL